MKNKRGVFFTVVVIFILTLFFMSYTIYDVVVDRSAVNRRVETLNNFVSSVEHDIPRYLYVAGFRSIFLVHEEIVASNNYIGSVNDSFQELFYNGSLGGATKTLMNGAKFDDMKDAFETSSLKINANVDFSSPAISVDQVDPWNIRVKLSIGVKIEDVGGLVRWDRNMSTYALIPIEGFEDPLYLIETGQVTNSFYETPYTDFVLGADTSNFSLHIQNSYYYASDSAPSFLKRFEGDNSPDSNGIESFVYLPKLTAQGLSAQDKSVIDYIYFSSDDPLDYGISGMPSWFNIDNESAHLEDYGVDGLIV